MRPGRRRSGRRRSGPWSRRPYSTSTHTWDRCAAAPRSCPGCSRVARSRPRRSSSWRGRKRTCAPPPARHGARRDVADDHRWDAGRAPCGASRAQAHSDRWRRVQEECSPWAPCRRGGLARGPPAAAPAAARTAAASRPGTLPSGRRTSAEAPRSCRRSRRADAPGRGIAGARRRVAPGPRGVAPGRSPGRQGWEVSAPS